MDSDLKALEEKLSQLISLCEGLRNENVQLKNAISTMESNTVVLQAKMAQASERIEALMESLP